MYNQAKNLYEHQIPASIKPNIDPQGLICAVLQVAKFIYNAGRIMKT